MRHKRPSLPFFLLLTLLEMLFVTSASIAVPLLFRPFYYLHIPLLDLPARTGWTAVEIRGAYDEMMDFCIGGAPFGTGVLRWSESGMTHFADCAVLFRLDLSVLAVSALALLICFLLYHLGLRPAEPLGRGPAFWAGSTLAIAFLLLAILAALNFNAAFVTFHHIFFPGKSNWMFDPAADEIILILPQVFFQNCAVLIAALLFLFCAVLIWWDLRGTRRRHFRAGISRQAV